MSLVSIIIPVYNAENTLEKAIRSAISQSYSAVEILLVDDGSTDKSPRICDEWSVKDNRIKVFHKQNGGVSSARNYGLEKAKGDYILMLDSDDELDLNACEVLINKIEDYDVLIFGSKGDVIILPPQDKSYKSLAEFHVDFLNLLNIELLSPSWNKFYRKNFIKTGFPIDISFGEDLVFALNYLSHCEKIRMITNQLYIYKTESNISLSRSFNITRIEDIEKYQKMILSLFGLINSGDDMIYQKYLNDSLNYVRELYCSKCYSYNLKVNILKEWYSKSYIKREQLKYSGSLFYKALYFCVKHQLWILPQIILYIARMIQLKNIIK